MLDFMVHMENELFEKDLQFVSFRYENITNVDNWRTDLTMFCDSFDLLNTPPR